MSITNATLQEKSEKVAADHSKSSVRKGSEHRVRPSHCPLALGVAVSERDAANLEQRGPTSRLTCEGWKTERKNLGSCWCHLSCEINQP